MDLAATTVAVSLLGTFLIAFMKGAFGGGFAIIGIPLLTLVMDPLTAGAILAPLLVAMDAVALAVWRPSTWSKPDLAALIPALLVGIGAGYLVLDRLDERAASVAMAVVVLCFAALWARGGGIVVPRRRSTSAAILAGFGAGVTTMVAHSGGPPLAMYLLPLGLSKAVYSGTTSVVFTVGNLSKAGAWLALVRPTSADWALIGLCLLAIPPGVCLGWLLHRRLDQRRLFRLCYGLLVITALKLLWDGLRGYA